MVDRKRKLRVRQMRLATLRTRWREPFDKIIRVLGLGKYLKRFPRAEACMFKHRYPCPEVIVDAKAVDRPTMDVLASQVRDFLQTMPIRTHPEITAWEFFTAGVALYDFFTRLRCHDPAARFEEFLSYPLAALRQFRDENLEPLVEQLLVGLDRIAATASTVNGRLVWAYADSIVLPRDKKLLRITIFSAEPVVKHFMIDGHTRPAYRVGGPYQEPTVAWVNWAEADVRLGGGTGQYPVYVQSHAIERLHERVPFPWTWDVHDAMFTSLLNPVVCDRRPGEVLIEYRYNGYRLGYFVARLVENEVVVTTFLFLTMQGTPEAKRLRDKLKLRRPDIEHLRLDEITTYCLTDLHADPELVAIFKECGCGHLLDLLTPEARAQVPTGFSREVRRYLGLHQ